MPPHDVNVLFTIFGIRYHFIEDSLESVDSSADQFVCVKYTFNTKNLIKIVPISLPLE